jgi:RHS repeat-associated protein
VPEERPAFAQTWLATFNPVASITSVGNRGGTTLLDGHLPPGERVEDPHLELFYTYDSQGNIASVTDGLGSLTGRLSDTMGRVTKITDAASEETRYTYSGPNPANAGYLVTQVERGHTTAAGEGQVTKLVYNAESRLVQVQRKDDSGNFPVFWTFTVDSDGNRLTATDGENRTTTFGYDARDQLISVTPPGLSPTQHAYDATGRRIRVTDAFGRITNYTFDALDRLIQTQTASITPNLNTLFGYDALGHMTTVLDPNNQVTTYGYDSLSRLISVTQPLGQVVQYAYDGRGRLQQLTNARGNVLKYQYYDWGPLQEADHYTTASATTPARSLTYGYDNAGNLTSTGDSTLSPNPIYTASYDVLSRPQVVTVKYIPGGDRTLTNSYDRYGNRSQLSLVDGSQTLVYTYPVNKLNQLTTATLPGAGGVGSQTVSFAYFNDDDLKTVTRTSGVTATYSYEPYGPAQSISVQSSSSGLLERYSYGYDNVANPLSMTDNDGTHSYGYDNVYRLTSASHPASSGLPASESFSYDGAGNNNSSGFSFDSDNRITASPGLTYSFDADGNIATRSDGTAFGYDFINRLRTFTKGSTSAAYSYDPFARRILKTVNGTPTWFLWDGAELLAEYSGAGVRTTRYAYAGKYAPIQIDQGGVLYDVHSDRLKTPRILSTSTQGIAWRDTLQVYGQAKVTDNISGPHVTLNFRFPGQYADAESGLYYNNFRTYDPNTGRYLEVDPIGQSGAINVYGYASQNPLQWSDFYGLSDISYDGNTHVLTIHRDDGTTETFPAYNNVDSHSEGQWPSGTFPYDQHVTHADDSPDSAFGSSGGYSFDVPGRSGMEIHSGREDTPDGLGRTGPQHATMGCIRTTDQGTAAIQRAIDAGDPPTNLTVTQPGTAATPATPPPPPTPPATTAPAPAPATTTPQQPQSNQ